MGSKRAGSGRAFRGVVLVAAYLCVTSPCPASEIPVAADGADGLDPVGWVVSGWSAAIDFLRRGIPDGGAPTVVEARGTCAPTAEGGEDCAVAARVTCLRQGFDHGIALEKARGRVCRGSPSVASETTRGDGCRRKTWITLAACW